MQRTDQAERFLERLASVPLTWENVFRSPQYTVKSDKEVVDLLLALRNRGIFVSMKCQQDPEKRTGDKLVWWVQKSAEAALRQVRGGIKTSKTREFWCNHPRRGQVSFKPNQIEPVRAVVVVETQEEVALSQDMPLEIDSVPVGNVFFAVEIGQRHVMVSGGCRASFNVPVESGIVRLKGDHKLGHLAVALESPEAPFGFQGTGGAPAQDHAAALPSLDAA